MNVKRQVSLGDGVLAGLGPGPLGEPPPRAVPRDSRGTGLGLPVVGRGRGSHSGRDRASTLRAVRMVLDVSRRLMAGPRCGFVVSPLPVSGREHVAELSNGILMMWPVPLAAACHSLPA